MKYFLLFASLLSMNIGLTQENNYDLGSPEHLLDGTSLNYQYQNQSAIHIEFIDNEIKYKWILGPNKDKPERTYAYKSRQLDQGMYLVNWHETDLKNFITLVFNFNSRMVSSSVIVRYGEEKQFTTFDIGFIDQLKK